MTISWVFFCSFTSVNTYSYDFLFAIMYIRYSPSIHEGMLHVT